MTENGWPSCGPDQLDRAPVPGTSGKLVIPLQRGIPATIMRAFAADIHAHVESLNNARGYTDEGGWTPTNSVATSNHLGGTAMDLNWSEHPMGNANAGWSPSEIAGVRDLLGFYEGMIFWGNDWTSPKDGMHFQMGYNTFNNQAKCNDFIHRKIRGDGFSTYRRGAPASDANAFPLPDGYFYGPKEWDDDSISGQAGESQAWIDGLKRWQGAVGVPMTGVWDIPTINAATQLQKQKGWPQTNGTWGTVHKGEWDAVIREGWHLAKPVVVGPADDQLTFRWNNLGGQTMEEALAEVRDKVCGTNDKDKTGVVMK